MKKEWQAPTLEVLDVSMTMSGIGSTRVDWTWVGGKLDGDLYDS